MIFLIKALFFGGFYLTKPNFDSPFNIKKCFQNTKKPFFFF
ncbi:hypothetical protein HPOKI154_07990 [Helicobacter pylori oki154]|nr:hypothetical protein HPOKI154_07990 [Helicobacter pylori oki154]